MGDSGIRFIEPPQPNERVLAYELSGNFTAEDMRAFLERLEVYRKAATAYDAAWALFDDEAITAVDAFREAHGLVYPGNPRGLVDERFVEALRTAYYTPLPPSDQ